MLAEIMVVVYLFAAFAWAVKDLNDRIDEYGIRWWMVFLFFFMFVFMPVLAFIEKIYADTDWLYIVKGWINR